MSFCADDVLFYGVVSTSLREDTGQIIAKRVPANPHTFLYKPPDRESVVIGTWSPAGLDRSRGAAVLLVICSTDDRETAELWRAELAAGRLPQSTEDVP